MKLRTLRFLPLGFFLGFLGGCASSGPPLPPSLELPARVTDLRAVRKGNLVYLAWSVPERTTDHQSIRQLGITRVCRSPAFPMTSCGSPIGEVRATAVPASAVPASAGRAMPKQNAAPPKITAGFVDHIPERAGARPDERIAYAVEVLNGRGRGAGLSNQLRVPLFPAAPPPDDFRAEITDAGVRISWNCSAELSAQAGVEYRVRVYRRLAGSTADAIAADANCSGSPVLDQGFEWEKKYDYRAAVITSVTDAGSEISIEGDDTPSVPVFAHDIFPPAVPNGLQAVYSGAGQQSFIDLTWTPDSDADLAGYNVYRHEEGGSPVKLNRELVAAPAYRDAKVQPGKKYFYSVSAVDGHGNESEKSPEASEAVPEAVP